MQGSTPPSTFIVPRTFKSISCCQYFSLKDEICTKCHILRITTRSHLCVVHNACVGDENLYFAQLRLDLLHHGGDRVAVGDIATHRDGCTTRLLDARAQISQSVTCGCFSKSSLELTFLSFSQRKQRARLPQQPAWSRLPRRCQTKRQ